MGKDMDRAEGGGGENAAGVVRPGIYRHYKGGMYEALCTARHSETLEEMVVYRALYGERGTWVRPASMWGETVSVGGRESKRFERVG